MIREWSWRKRALLYLAVLFSLWMFTVGKYFASDIRCFLVWLFPEFLGIAFAAIGVGMFFGSERFQRFFQLRHPYFPLIAALLAGFCLMHLYDNYIEPFLLSPLEEAYRKFLEAQLEAEQGINIAFINIGFASGITLLKRQLTGVVALLITGIEMLFVRIPRSRLTKQSSADTTR